VKPELVSELVRLRLKQAQETLVDARTLLEAGRTPRSVVNRAYYSPEPMAEAFCRELTPGAARLHLGMDRQRRQSQREIKKVVRKARLEDLCEVSENLTYWLSRSPAERVAAVEQLRSTHAGTSARLQRLARVVQRPRS
jgi:hypothetical protein